MYEPHMTNLQQANNKGKIAEVKFARNQVAYLLEAAFHSFSAMHVQYISPDLVKFVAV